MLYFDTNSVIYKSTTGEDLLETGDFLGDLTDELGGHEIVEFVSAGPKIMPTSWMMVLAIVK